MGTSRELILLSGLLYDQPERMNMKGELKRLTLLILVLLATLVAASPALAAGPANQNRHGSQNNHRISGQTDMLPGRPLFALTGTITALRADSFTVLVYNGNRFVKPCQEHW